MNTINGDVFVGKIIKSFPVDKGFKGMLKVDEDLSVGLQLIYDGKLKDFLTENVGKTVTLIGSLTFPSKEQSIPVLEVRGSLGNGLNGLIVKRGRLTKDPELRYSPQGKAYTQFSMAVNRGYGDNKTSYFINCTIFGNDREKNAATSLAENAQKGQELIIKGRLTSNKSGDKTYYNMIADEFELIYSDSKTGGNGNSKKGKDDPYAAYLDIGTEVGCDDDDIPF